MKQDERYGFHSVAMRLQAKAGARGAGYSRCDLIRA